MTAAIRKARVTVRTILFMVGGARCGSGRYPYTILDSAVFDAHRS